MSHLGRTARCLLACGAWLVAGVTTAGAHAPQPPLEITLRADANALVWSLNAHTRLQVQATRWQVRGSALVPALPAWDGRWFEAEATESGSIPWRTTPGLWVEVQLDVRTPAGVLTLGAATRRRLDKTATPLGVAIAKSTSIAAGVVQAHFFYEARVVGRAGYTGASRVVPVRGADAVLLDAVSRAEIARGALDDDGALRLTLPAPVIARPAVIRLESATAAHPAWNLAVVTPPPDRPNSAADARPHGLETQPFLLDPAGNDLGRIVARDPDGFGAVQAFHIFDLARDVFVAVGSAAFPGPTLGRADSLRIFWGPELRIRASAQAGHEIEITSPSSGDTDGWSDAVVLHEIGHFVAQRLFRDANPGGIHLLGDVDQDVRLAWSEGFATAFACWMRDWRATHRRDANGTPVDDDVATYVNVGLPPPNGLPGALQFAWDVDGDRLGAIALARQGIGSETNVAGILWDAVDAAGRTGPDDESVALGTARVFGALRSLRAVPNATPISFEDFWRAWRRTDSEPEALAPLLAAGEVEFVPDAAEPDDAGRAGDPWLWAARSRQAEGGVLLSEIAVGVSIAVEIVNRDSVPHDLAGWALVARSNSSSTNPSLTYTLPPATVLGPGARLVVHRDGDPRANTWHDVWAPNWTAPWFPAQEGALALLDASAHGVDFVRWNARDGTRALLSPPAGTHWQGNLEAAPFGASLQRSNRFPDRDLAADFTAGPQSLGAPNDTPSVHRTFFPAADIDVMRFDIVTEGVYTVEVRRARNGAVPRLELWRPGAARALAVSDPSSADAPRLTVQLAAGEPIEIRLRHTGSLTQFGTYDVALYAEPDAAPLLAPIGVDADVQVVGTAGAVHLHWRNASHYDRVRVRIDAGPWVALSGDANAWDSGRLERGSHAVELAATARGLEIAAPALAVDVDAWPAARAANFQAPLAPEWRISGGWERAPAPGRPALALTESPSGAYADGSEATAAWNATVLVAANTVLEFDHICAVRPEDVAAVEITDTWGGRWALLERWNWNAHADPQGANWRDGSAGPGDWVHERLPLGAWAGRPVQIRFRFAADIHATADGWWIDAVRFVSEAPPRFALQLGNALPNPFNPTTRIPVVINAAVHVRAVIVDARGRIVRHLLDADQPALPFDLWWDGRDYAGRPAASGVYFCHVTAGNTAATRKLVLAR